MTYKMKVKDFNVYSYYLFSSIILALALSAVKAGGIENLSNFDGFLFWIVHSQVAIFIYSVALSLFAKTISINKLLNFCLVSLFGALLFGLIAIFLEAPFYPTQINFESILNEILPAASQSYTFWILINLPLLMQDTFSSPKIKNAEIQNLNLEKKSNLINHLAKNAQELMYISAEGNYLRLHFENTTELVLYTLKDAINELSDGIQIHRSHWVKLSQIEKRMYKNKAPFLVLKNGAILPIGRKYLRNVIDNPN
jgi:hypothetical protein